MIIGPAGSFASLRPGCGRAAAVLLVVFAACGRVVRFMATRPTCSDGCKFPQYYVFVAMGKRAIFGCNREPIKGAFSNGPNDVTSAAGASQKRFLHAETYNCRFAPRDRWDS